MPAKVVKIYEKTEHKIYRPIGCKAGEKFITVEMRDSFITIPPGSILTFTVGDVRARGIHAVRIPGSHCLVRYIERQSDKTILLWCSNPQYETMFYPEGEVEIIGHVRQMYINGDCWEAIPEEARSQTNYSIPLLKFSVK